MSIFSTKSRKATSQPGTFETLPLRSAITSAPSITTPSSASSVQSGERRMTSRKPSGWTRRFMSCAKIRISGSSSVSLTPEKA